MGLEDLDRYLDEQRPGALPNSRPAIEKGVQVIHQTLQRAREGTEEKMTRTPGGQPAMGSTARSIAGFLNPVPGGIPEALGMAATLPFGGQGVGSGLLRNLTRGTAITAPLKRATAAGVMTGGTSLIGGATPEASFEKGAGMAGGQLVGEAAALPFRFLAHRSAANRLAGERTNALADREKKIAFDKAMHKAVTGAEEAGYETDVARTKTKYAEDLAQAKLGHKRQAVRAKTQYESDVANQERRHAQDVEGATSAHERARTAYSDTAAGKIADAFKAVVPAWEDMPSNTRGLLDMVYGKGQAAISERFDVVMKEIAEKGKGLEVTLSEKDAATLGLKPQKWVDRPDLGKGARDALVGADHAAKAAVGKWTKEPQTYRRVVEALDKIDVGDKAARGEYRAAQALIQFADKTRMLKGETFNPDAAQSGFTSLKVVNELRRRGQGNIFEGPISEALRVGRPGPVQLPSEPAPIPKPVTQPFAGIPKPTMPTPPAYRPAPPTPAMPPTLEEQGVITRTLPGKGHQYLAGHATGAAGGAIAHGLGAPWFTGFLPGEAAGFALAGKPIVTQAPLPTTTVSFPRTRFNMTRQGLGPPRRRTAEEARVDVPTLEALLRASPMLTNLYLRRLMDPDAR